jgi:hypothetical protein
VIYVVVAAVLEVVAAIAVWRYSQETPAEPGESDSAAS